MAMSLKDYLNSKIKSKGSSLTKEKAKAGKYKSISSAKKAGALYYTNKDGKVMAAVFAEDLKAAKPKKKKPGPLQGPTKNRGTIDEKVEVDKANKKPMGTAALTKMVLVALGPAETKKSKPTAKVKPKVKPKSRPTVTELKAKVRKLRTKIANARQKGKDDKTSAAEIKRLTAMINRLK